MRDYKKTADKYYELSQQTISIENQTKGILKDAYQAGFEQGVEWAVNDMDNIWHRKTKDGGWTDWGTVSIPCGEELIVTVYDDNCDNPYYYTTSAWYLEGYWIHDNDILNGLVVAWKDFPKPYKEK